MAKKTKEKKSVEEIHEQPRRHISRRRHEQELQRRIYLGLGIVLGLVALLLAAGAINEYFIKPNKPVATVNGEKIGQDAFRRRLRFEQDNLVLQINQYLQFGEQFANGGPNPFLSTIQPLYEQLKNPVQLADSVVDKMTDEKLVHQLAAKYDAVPTPEEVQAEIERQFGFDRNAEKPSDENADAAPPMTEEDFKTRYQEYVNDLSQKNSLTEEEFRDLFATQLMRTKLAETVDLDIDTTDEAVKARIIVIKPEPEVPLVKREADALKKITEARARIVDGGEDFAAVAKEISEDPGSGANGGELGCFGKGQMVPEFEEAAFSLAKGEVSQPVKTDFGYHLIQVYDTKPDEDQVCARHILIRVDRSPDQEAIDKADAEAQKKLAEIKARIENGEDFATVAKEVSEDPLTAEKGGDLGWVFRGEREEAFDQVAFALAPGQISDPVKLADGYAIILVEEKDPEHPIKEEELEKRRQQAFNDWMIAQTSEADIVKTLTPDMVPDLPADLVSIIRSLAPQLESPVQPAQ